MTRWWPAVAAFPPPAYVICLMVLYPVILSAWVLGVRVHLNAMVFTHCLRNGCDPAYAWHNVFTDIGVARGIGEKHREEIEKLNSFIAYNNLRAWVVRSPTNSSEDRAYYDGYGMTLTHILSAGMTGAALATSLAGFGVPFVAVASLSSFAGVQATGRYVVGFDGHRSRNATELIIQYEDAVRSRPLPYQLADSAFWLVAQVPTATLSYAVDQLPVIDTVASSPLPGWDTAPAPLGPAPRTLSDAVLDSLQAVLSETWFSLRTASSASEVLWILACLLVRVWAL